MGETPDEGNLKEVTEQDKFMKDVYQRELGKDFKLVKDKKVLAHTSGFDGFYMAQLERKKWVSHTQHLKKKMWKVKKKCIEKVLF